MGLILPDDPAIQRYFAAEQPIRDAYWHPTAGEVVVDIGCALGSYTLPALAAGATVHAFDADPAALATLAMLCHLNGFDQCFSQALCVGAPYPPERLGEIPPYMRPGGPWVTLDSLGISRCDWLKVDVEGGEYEVLADGCGLLGAQMPFLLVEDHRTVYSHVRDCQPLLVKLGYEVQHVPYEDADGARAYWVGFP
jgi:hypothetical protein